MRAAANTSNSAAPTAPAPSPRQKEFTDLKTLCAKIRKEASLVPPSVVDALCEGVSPRWICLEATYVKEVEEIARLLNREHLLVFTADCD